MHRRVFPTERISVGNLIVALSFSTIYHCTSSPLESRSDGPSSLLRAVEARANFQQRSSLSLTDQSQCLPSSNISLEGLILSEKEKLILEGLCWHNKTSSRAVALQVDSSRGIPEGVSCKATTW